MFDFGGSGKDDSNNMEDVKYTFIEKEEFSEKEILSMEKEMLGIYLSGHPLEKLKEQILHQTTINSDELKELGSGTSEEENEIVYDESKIALNEKKELKFKDGQEVIYAGIISSIKKKFTKNNKIMAFVTVEDLYGTAEIIVFENVYLSAGNSLTEENIVLIKGRLSIRDEESATIIAREITDFGAQKRNVLDLDITGIDETTKIKLRGAIKFFSGDMNNLAVQIRENDKIKPCGAIYCTDNIMKIFQEILGHNRVQVRCF